MFYIYIYVYIPQTARAVRGSHVFEIGVYQLGRPNSGRWLVVSRCVPPSLFVLFSL